MRTPVYARIKETMAVTLSILIPTLPSRRDTLMSLVDTLQYQIQNKPVQLLWLGDNKSMTVGEKRNQLLSMAGGDWVCFIDDDDRPSPHYIELLLAAIKDHPEKSVITFMGTQNKDGKQDIPFRYSLQFGRNLKTVIDGQRWHVMLPDHLCCWRKDKIAHSFPKKSLGEDHAWGREQAMTITESDIFEIPAYLYHYEYNSQFTECRR